MAIATLYWFPLSHPSWAVRKALELKGIQPEEVRVLPGTQRVHLRLARFRGGTVPALKLDGRRVQGSRTITRVLDDLVGEPALFPAERDARAAVEEAERWGEAGVGWGGGRRGGGGIHRGKSTAAPREMWSRE